MTSQYEYLTQISEHFPEIIPAKKRVSGSMGSRIQNDGELRHRCDNMFSNLVSLQNTTSIDAQAELESYQKMSTLLQQYVTFCK